MSGHQDYTGDYTYDLANEVRTGVTIPAQRRGLPVIQGVPFDRDPDGDVSDAPEELSRMD